MDTTKIKKTLKGLGLVSAVAFGMTMFSGTSANAQIYRGGRDNDRYEQRNRQYNNRDYNNNNSREIRSAMERGYRDGLKQGERAARSRRGGYGNNGGYYGSGNGSRVQRAYQEGFQRGFREGYNRGQSNRRGGIHWPF